MNDRDKTQLGKTLWGIADDLRGAMNADDFRDYMLSFLFLRYLSDNYEAGREKGAGAGLSRRSRATTAVCRWPSGMPTIPMTWPISRSRCAARCTMSSNRITSGPASPIWPARRMENCSTRCKQPSNISRRSPSKAPSKACSPRSIWLGQARQKIRRAQRQALHHHSKDRRRVDAILHRRRHVGRCLRISDRPVCRRFRQEGGRVLHAAADF
jgi:hypothetical protein